MAKKKKKDNYWGSADEQEKLADEFYDYVESINTDEKKDEKKVWKTEGEKSSSNFQYELEALITGVNLDEVKKNAKKAQQKLAKVDERITIGDGGEPTVDVSDLLDKVESGELDDSVLGSAQLNVPLPSAIDTIVNSRSLGVLILRDLDRIIIDDGISPNSFYMETSECEGLNFEDGKDDTEAVETIDLLTKYIITLKHPTAVYTKDEFVKIFGNVGDYSDIPYYFGTCEDFVFAYRINAETIGNLHEYIDNTRPSLNDKIDVYASLAYVTGRHEAVWLTGDDDYVVMMYESVYNEKDLFAKKFLNDPSTVIVDTKAGSFDELMERLNTFDDIYRVQDLGRDILGMFLNGVEDAEDEDDEDDEDEDVPVPPRIPSNPPTMPSNIDINNIGELVSVEEVEEDDADIDIDVDDENEEEDDSVDEVVEAIMKEEDKEQEKEPEPEKPVQQVKKQPKKQPQKQNTNFSDDLTIPVIRRGGGK